MTAHEAVLQLDRIDAVLFDTDGVVTDTARLHADAWKRTFDEFLARRGREIGLELAPFDSSDDYLQFLKGRSHRDGLRTFLASRGFELADCNGPSAADADTVWSLTERKDAVFLAELEHGQVAAFPDTIRLLQELRQRSVATAAVSASRHSRQTLLAAGATRLFDVRVDGAMLARLNLPGKPDPALFSEAVRRLGVTPWRTAVIDDALAGIEAGQRGRFRVVIGVDRNGDMAGELYERGATVVVRSLADVVVSGHRLRPLVARP